LLARSCGGCGFVGEVHLFDGRGCGGRGIGLRGERPFWFDVLDWLDWMVYVMRLAQIGRRRYVKNGLRYRKGDRVDDPSYCLSLSSGRISPEPKGLVGGAWPSQI
jgi:hypothetical protein